MEAYDLGGMTMECRLVEIDVEAGKEIRSATDSAVPAEENGFPDQGLGEEEAGIRAFPTNLPCPAGRLAL